MQEQNTKPQKSSGKAKKVVSTILIIALVVAAIYGYQYLKSYLNRPTVNLTAVERASFNRTLNLNAQIEAQESQLVTSDYGLVIDNILVKEGDFVKRGQELYSYSASNARKRVRKAKDKLALLDEEDKERQERYETILSEMATQLSEQMGLSIQESTSMLADNLKNFDLKGQFTDLIPEGLSDLANSGNISETINSLNRALNTSDSTIAEIGKLVQKVNYSGLTEMSAAGLFQLLVQAESLYDQVSGILSSAKKLLDETPNLPAELEAFIKGIIAEAKVQLGKLHALIEQIESWLEKPSGNYSSAPLDLPVLPDPDNGDSLAPEESIPESIEDPNEAPATENRGETEGSDDKLNDPDSPGDTPPDNNDGNDDSEVDPSNSPDKVNAGTAIFAGQGKSALVSFFSPSRFVAAEEKTSKNLTAPATENGDDINPGLLLALLKMDQNQGKSERDQLEAEVAGLEDLLKSKKLTVKANIDGLVASLPLKKGEAVEKGEMEALLLDNNQLIAHCWVGKQDASRLEVGQPVVYYYDDLDLYGEITYKAAIAGPEPSKLLGLGALSSELGLDAAAGLLGGDVTAGSAKVEIRMSIEGPDLDLITIGFDINGEVEIDQVENVKSIPIECLIQERDKYYVYYVDEDSVLQEKEIELGLVGQSRVEIKSGLEEGDTIVSNAMSGLQLGQKVKINDTNDK